MEIWEFVRGRDGPKYLKSSHVRAWHAKTGSVLQSLDKSLFIGFPQILQGGYAQTFVRELYSQKNV